MRARGALLALSIVALSSRAIARPRSVALDRVVVRFSAPELGGARAARAITERELAFGARLEALADPERRADDPRPYRERHVRAAIERLVAETLLAAARIEPEPTPQEVRQRRREARAALEARVGAPEALDDARRAEGLSAAELDELIARSARAALYLDRMVAPLVAPSDAELAALHRSGVTPFSGRAFASVRAPLRRWVMARRLSAALTAHYQSARSRVRVLRVPAAR